LKPAVEIIVVFQKPYRGKPVECITRTGAGALNIDGGRIGYKSEGDKRKNTEGLERFHSTSGNSGTFMASDKIKPNIDSTSLGRWAANFIVSHSPDCVHIGDNGASRWACVAECAVRRLDEQSGERKTCSPNQIGMGRDGNFTNGIYGAKASKITTAYGDTGGASRFFFNVAQQIDEADPVRYCAKASRRERDAGCEGMREYNAGTYAQDEWSRQNMGNTPDAKRNPIHNPHPTVKPMSLTRYLATLLLPPAEYAPRRIFVPFGGSGSEIIGCALAGWEEVVGVEREQEYVSIAKARVKFWVAKMKENYSSDPSAILKTCGKKDKEKPDLQEHSPAESLFEISAKE
jgi:site-specific DNA-methyltransferase (adenine-specific)